MKMVFNHIAIGNRDAIEIIAKNRKGHSQIILSECSVSTLSKALE